MKKVLLILVATVISLAMANAQEILINDFTGTIDPSKIYGDDYETMDGKRNQSIVSFENNMLKAVYSFNKPDWFPRAVWYNFDAPVDMSNTPVLVVKFMVEDNDNDSITIRLDLHADEAVTEGEARKKMETNGKPWAFKAVNGEWYEVESNFTTEDRWFCTYYTTSIPATRLDSSKVTGFEAFANYGNGNLADQPGTLWIDFIKVKVGTTGLERVIYGKENPFSLIVYQVGTNNTIRLKSQNLMSNIQLIDLTGKTMYSAHKVNAIDHEVNVGAFTNGIYVAKVTDLNGKIATRKFQVK
jgi:hypothetical protein